MGNLDPTAEEFRPTNPNHRTPPPALLFRPPPPPPPPYPQPYVFPYAPTPLVQLQTATFFDHTVEVRCPQFPPPTAAVALSTSPTRSLLLSLVPSEAVVGESTLRKELEAFGDVRGVQMEGLYDGMVMATVQFYDLRHAEAAFTAIRWQYMHYHTRINSQHNYALVPPPPVARGLASGGVVWAQYIVPGCDDVGDGENQGTIVVFNLDFKVDTDSLREIFEAFGAVKDLKHTPFRRNQRFVEYFDIRDAAKALKQMNGREIHGRPVVIEFSRPAGRGHYCRNNFKPPPPHKLRPRFAPHYDDDGGTSPSHRSHMMESTVTKVSSSLHDNKTTEAEAALASVNLGDQERQYSQGPSKRNSIGGTKTTTATTHEQQEAARSTRNWNKGKHAKKLEARFQIKDEDATLESSNSCVDSRTTVMIKNIPNKYSQKLLLNMLDTHCNHCNEQIERGDDQPLSSYDFVYLPIDFNNKCNVGYGFVNMTSPEATLRLYKAFHHQHWQVFNSRKICEVTYARVQGLEALKEHFKNSKFPYEMEQYCLPVVFSPPRHGRQLTEPLAIVGSDHHHNQQKQKHQLSSMMMMMMSTTLPIGAPSESDDNDDLLSSSRSSQNGGIEGDDDGHSTAATTGTCCCSGSSSSDESSGSQ